MSSTRNRTSSTARVGAALAIVLAIDVSGCGKLDSTVTAPPAAIRWRADKPAVVETTAKAEEDSAVPRQEARAGQRAAHLESLLKRGEFGTFVEEALAAGSESTAAVELLKVEALLATGRAAEAQVHAQRAAQLALGANDYDSSSHALTRWAIARFRAAQPLEGPWFDALAATFPPYDPTVTMLRFWSDAIGQRAPYATSITGGGAHQLARGSRTAESHAAQLNAIAVRVNDVALNTVFIDTGAQHSVMSIEAAAAAGVIPGPSGLRLSGFANVAARPGLIRSLDLGGIVLRDVPVMIGDSAPLAAAGGQMALGTELLHHVNLTIDYPAGRVIATLPGARADASDCWQIPLWTFSQVCLAQGQLPSGASARVLVDTGDGSGTYVSSRWARRHLAGFPKSRGPVVFKTPVRDLALARMELGTSGLDDWPVVDVLPAELERVNAVDVLVGHDLLASYKVDIDMRGRVLRLHRWQNSSDRDEN